MDFFADLEQGLLEAIEVKEGGVALTEKENMPAPTFVVSDKDQKLIDELVKIRKDQKISQSKLAELTGNKQQAISRIEQKEHSPSLKLFSNMANALGYEIKLVKQSI